MVPGSFCRVLGVLALLAVATPSAYADKCTAAKLKALGKKEAGLLNCRAKDAANPTFSPFTCGLPVEKKFNDAFAKAGSCNGDAVECEWFALGCYDRIAQDLGQFATGKCTAQRVKAAGKKAAATLACNAKAATKDMPVDAACIQKAELKYEAAFTKATGCAGDELTVENDVDQMCVAAAGGDASGGATVGQLCPNPFSSCVGVEGTPGCGTGGRCSLECATNRPVCASENDIQAGVLAIPCGAPSYTCPPGYTCTGLPDSVATCGQCQYYSAINGCFVASAFCTRLSF